MALSAYSQEHLHFMGHPIDGTQSEFNKKIELMGFNRKVRTLNYEGTFFGKPKTYVAPQFDGDNLWAVYVLFKPQKSWDKLYADYKELKEQLIKKYGQPSKSVEYFDDCTDADDNKKKTKSCKKGNAHFSTTFFLESGTIDLSISSKQLNISLCYIDKINSSKRRKTIADDL